MNLRSVILVCTSVHHGNTRKVAEVIASATDAIVFEPGSEALEAARDGAMLGLGSGIFYGSHHKDLTAFAGALPDRESGTAFLFSTSGTGYRLPHLIGQDYHRKLRGILKGKGYAIAGEFSCKGFDTYGPWGKLGGVAKGHPNDMDLENARAFALGLMQET